LTIADAENIYRHTFSFYPKYRQLVCVATRW